MTYRIITRTEAGLPAVVRSAGGTPRPPLSNEPMIICHYTGNNVDYTGRDTAEITRQIQRVFAATKPFEYNYVIGQNDDDQIVEYAGKFQAAHSGGENHIAFGVLFLLGVGEDPTPTMWNKYRWLRDALIFGGSLAPNPTQLMHFQAPGAATACPGNIRNFWPEFIKPYVPPIERGIDMATANDVYIALPPAGMPGNPPWFLVEKFGGGVRYAMNRDAGPVKADGTPLIEQVPSEQDQYNNLYAQVFK